VKKEIECKTCEGTGRVRDTAFHGSGHIPASDGKVRCHRCSATGKRTIDLYTKKEIDVEFLDSYKDSKGFNAIEFLMNKVVELTNEVRDLKRNTMKLD
jgi:hypothetical protein